MSLRVYVECICLASFHLVFERNSIFVAVILSICRHPLEFFKAFNACRPASYVREFLGSVCILNWMILFGELNSNLILFRSYVYRLHDECVMALALVQIDSCVLSLLLPLLLLLVCSLRNVREIILYKLHWQPFYLYTLFVSKMIVKWFIWCIYTNILGASVGLFIFAEYKPLCVCDVYVLLLYRCQHKVMAHGKREVKWRVGQPNYAAQYACLLNS